MVLAEKRGGLGSLTLDNPKRLNALDLPMFERMAAFLEDCAHDPAIRAILIQGAGDKAFCSGGDVRRVATEDFAYGKRFFELEYGTDLKIHLYPKPVIALGHGITMGGGLGLLAGAKLRCLAEDSVIAMPEVSIGFFTDVGATWFLNQMPGKIGLFLGMTGARLSAWEAVELGLADWVVRREDLGRITAELTGELNGDLTLDLGSGRSGEAWVKRLQKSIDGLAVRAPSPSRYLAALSWIDRVCALDDAQAVYQELLAGPASQEARAEGGKWLRESLDGLRAGAPSSALLICRELRRARGRSIEECFRRELELALERMVDPDFREGVRARLIDKDHAPRWKGLTS